MNHRSNPSPRREGQVELLLAMSSRMRHGMSDDFESALELATRFLGLELGIQSRVEDDTYILESVYRPEDIAIEVGQTFELGQTY